MYERTQTIERQDSVASTGVVSGILATDGEASDGHVLNISGGEFKSGAPLLFNHDHMGGHLGSWTGFEKGKHELRGSAQIELDGRGEKAEWRKDVAHMVSQGHIGAFSVRWDGIGEPTRRTDLPKDHPAHVDQEREQDWSKLWGLYFDKWRLLEGSIVALPADQAALIGRMRDGSTYWQTILQRMAGLRESQSEDAVDARAMAEAFDAWSLSELEPVDFEDGRVFYVPKQMSERAESEMDEPELEAEDVMPEAVEEDQSVMPDPAPDVVREADIKLSREEMREIMLRPSAPEWEIREQIKEAFLYEMLGKVKQ